MNIFQILGYNTASQYPATSKTNVYYYALIKASGGTTYNASISESAVGVDAVSSSPVFASSISDTVVGTEQISSLVSLGASASESAIGTEQNSTLASLNAEVNANLSQFFESTYGIAVGTSLSGSVIWSTTSLSRVAVVADGTGSGSTGGFVAGGNYLAFGTAFGSFRINTVPINLQNVVSVSFDYINGTSSNGGLTPTAAMQIGTYDSVGTFTALLGAFPISGQSTFGVISFYVPPVSRVSVGSIRIVGITPSSPIYGIRSITLYYEGGLTSSETFSAAQIFASDIAEITYDTDSVSALLTGNSSVSESAVVTDSVASTASFSGSISDTVTGVDSISSDATFLASVSDTITGVDVISAAADFATDVAEATSGVDQIDAAPVFASNVAEAALGVDQNSVAASLNVFVNANQQTITQLTSTLPTGTTFAGATIFNASSATGGLTVAANGTGTGTTGGFSAGGNYILFTGANTRSVRTIPLNLTAGGTVNFYMIKGTSSNGGEQPDANENIILSYSINGGSSFTTISTVIAGGATPVVNPFTLFSVAIPVGAQTASTILKWEEATSSSGTNDTYGLKDITLISNSPVGASDSTSSLVSLGASIAETAIETDAPVGLADFASAIEEISYGVDDMAAAADFATNIADTVLGTEEVAASQGFASDIDETVSGVDADFTADNTFNAYSEEQVLGVDEASAAAIFPSAISENVYGADEISSSADFSTSIQETVLGQDSVSSSIDFVSSVAEAAVGFDAISSGADLQANFADTAAGVDSISSSLEYGAAVDETASGVDSVYAYQDFGVSVDETASGYDITDAAGSIYAAAFTDAASGIDQISAGGTYNVIVPEGVLALDQVYSRYLWELIDNSETADWGTISNTQTASWGEINDTQAASWQNIANTQPDGWTEIDDTQNPNWGRITP